MAAVNVQRFPKLIISVNDPEITVTPAPSGINFQAPGLGLVKVLRDEAQTTITEAGDARDIAVQAASDSVDAKDLSVTAKDEAVQAKTAAEQAANATAADRVQTGLDVTASTQAAANASASEIAAGQYMVQAGNSAQSAEDDAIASANSAAASEASRQATAQLFDQFGDQYLGPLASDPVIDNDGDPLNEGDVYWNTTDNVLKFYTGTVWAAPEDVATTAAANAVAAQNATQALRDEALGYRDATAADRIQTGLDAQATAADVITTNDNVVAAQQAETNATNSASAAAGSASAAADSATEAAASAASVPRAATDQEALDGADVVAWTDPAQVHAAFNQYGLGKPIVLDNKSLDTAVAAQFYVGFGGLSPAASTGDNPFPSTSSAFSLINTGEAFAVGDGYSTQIAILYNNSNVQIIKVRSLASTGAGWGGWQDVYTSATPATGTGLLVKQTSPQLDGTPTVNGLLVVGGDSVTANEGGQIDLTKALNSNADSNFSIDSYDDDIRIFNSFGGVIKVFQLRFSQISSGFVSLLHNQNMLGTVSQSGGIPTGAIIESGSNANGRYEKFASGFMVCYQTMVGLGAQSLSGSIYTSSGESTWSFPSTFSAVPKCTGSILTASVRWINIRATGVGAANIRDFCATSDANPKYIDLIAIGRWY